MEAKAHLRYARISPRKVQIVCDLIRGKSVAQANAILMATTTVLSILSETTRPTLVLREEVLFSMISFLLLIGLRAAAHG